jgi:hypothetical protein
MQHTTVRRLAIYGQPNEAVMAGMLPFAETGVTLTVTPHFTGFNRLLSSGDTAR